MPNSGLTSHGCILNVVMISQVDIISSSSYSYAEHRPKLVTHGFCGIITVLDYFIIEYVVDSTEVFISAEQLCFLQKFRRFNRCRLFLSYLQFMLSFIIYSKLSVRLVHFPIVDYIKIRGPN